MSAEAKKSILEAIRDWDIKNVPQRIQAMETVLGEEHEDVLHAKKLIEDPTIGGTFKFCEEHKEHEGTHYDNFMRRALLWKLEKNLPFSRVKERKLEEIKDHHGVDFYKWLQSIDVTWEELETIGTPECTLSYIRWHRVLLVIGRVAQSSGMDHEKMSTFLFGEKKQSMPSIPITKVLYEFEVFLDQLDKLRDSELPELARALESSVAQPRLETMQSMLREYMKDR